MSIVKIKSDLMVIIIGNISKSFCLRRECLNVMRIFNKVFLLFEDGYHYQRFVSFFGCDFGTF